MVQQLSTTSSQKLCVESKQELQTLRDECLALISAYIVQYMWHHDPFTLNVKPNCLYGRVRIGDNIEDEWFVISLLFKLTELKQDLVVKVSDACSHVPSAAEAVFISRSRAASYANRCAAHSMPSFELRV